MPLSLLLYLWNKFQANEIRNFTTIKKVFFYINCQTSCKLMGPKTLNILIKNIRHFVLYRLKYKQSPVIYKGQCQPVITSWSNITSPDNYILSFYCSLLCDCVTMFIVCGEALCSQEEGVYHVWQSGNNREIREFD